MCPNMCDSCPVSTTSAAAAIPGTCVNSQVYSVDTPISWLDDSGTLLAATTVQGRQLAGAALRQYTIDGFDASLYLGFGESEHEI